VQRVDAVEQPVGDRQLGIAPVLGHRAGGGVQVQAVAGAVVLGRGAQVGELHARRGACRQAQRDLAPVAAAGLQEALPQPAEVGRLRGCGSCGIRAAPGALGACRLAFAGGSVDGRAHHREAPVHARQARDQVAQQRQRAGHGVQVPKEGAAAQPPVQPQPGAPVQRPPRPAQDQAAQRQQQQRRGQRAGDELAGLARQQQPAVQLLDGLEQRIGTRLGQQLGRPRVGPVLRATARAWRGRKAHAHGPAGRRMQGERLHTRAASRLHARHQLGGCQRLRLRRGRCALEQLGMQRLDDLGAEGHQRARQADQHQHRAGGDAQQPVQLRQPPAQRAQCQRSTLTTAFNVRGAPTASRVPAAAQ
jgi:hypothetical protein